MRRSFGLGLLLVALLAAPARAQLPIHLSVNAGAAIPVRNDADHWNSGFHVGAGLKVALIPLQLDVALDRMDGRGVVEDLNITSAGVSFPVQITPPLLPLSAYLLAGGGLYHHFNGTDTGLNAGAGVRLGLPGIKLFGEGRGVVVFQEGNKLTYGTIGVGVAF